MPYVRRSISDALYMGRLCRWGIVCILRYHIDTIPIQAIYDNKKS